MAQDLLKKKKSKGSAAKLDNLKKEFETIQSTPLTRVVKLKHRFCDDCDCSFRNIERTVPYDSELKNGDKVYGELEKKDKYI